MKKFTRFWQLTMILVFMSSFAFAQSVEQKVQLKEQFKPQTATEEAVVEEMWKSGLGLNDLEAYETKSVEEIQQAATQITEKGPASKKSTVTKNATSGNSTGVVGITTSPVNFYRYRHGRTSY